MPRPKDARIWNEDLAAALEARHQQSLRGGKRDAHTWRVGRDKILSVRKDIYQFRTGTIANLPTGLTKTVQRLVEDVIRGVTSVYPDGHVPTNGGGGVGGSAGGFAIGSPPRSAGVKTPASSARKARPTTARSADDDNPFRTDHYMKTLKVRGGAFAILMAFRHSRTDVLRKAQICSEAQKFCDDQMEANYMAGRTYGAWKSIDTLKSRHLVTERGFRTFDAGGGGSGGGGFRDRPHEYALTRDGEMFVEALLECRPEAAAAAEQAAGASLGAYPMKQPSADVFGGSPRALDYLSPFPRRTVAAAAPSSNRHIRVDGNDLEEWVAAAEAGEEREFNVSKERRLHLHRLCDTLQEDNPGLLLTHSSSGTSRSRTLRIRIVRKAGMASSSSSWRKAPGTYSASSRGQRTVASAATPFVDLLGAPPRALDYSSPSAALPISVASSSYRNTRRNGDDLEEWVATSCEGDHGEFHVGSERRTYLEQLIDTMQEDNPGLKLSRRWSGNAQSRVLRIQILAKPGSASSASSRRRKRPLSHASPNISGYGQGTLGESSPASKRSRQLTPAQNAAAAATKRQQVAMEDANLRKAIDESTKSAEAPCRRRKIHDIEIQTISIDDDDDIIPQRSTKQPLQGSSTTPSTKASAKGNSHKKASLVSAIDLLHSDSSSSDDDLLKPTFSTQRVGRSPRSCKGLKSGTKRKHRPSPKGDRKTTCAKGGSYGGKNHCDDVIEIGDSQEEPIDLLDNHPDVFDANTDDDEVIIVGSNQGTKNNDIGELVVLIDNRERNRNKTPRTLRMELERHLESGPLSAVWPRLVPRAQVEETALRHGDFSFGIVCSASDERRRLGVSVERKRVNDLVQRSSQGDHLSQLCKMEQECSLGVLLIEYDTRMANRVTPYNAQYREGFDPFDTTVTCEDDVFRMFGRLILSSEKIKFIQSKDEQSSLRAIGALGLMCLAAQDVKTKEMQPIVSKEVGATKPSAGAQNLCDILKEGGIPWRLAKRVSSFIGGTIQLRSLYDSCSNKEAKSLVLCPLMVLNDERDLGGLRSTPEGWSDAIYRIIERTESSNDGGATNPRRYSGEGALLMHKDLMEDHGKYLSHFHMGLSPEEALDRTLESSDSIGGASGSAFQKRSVYIQLTEKQASTYFPSRGDDAFYQITIMASGKVPNSPPIVMHTECKHFVSKQVQVFELEGSELVDMMERVWEKHQGLDFVKLAQMIAKHVDSRCKYPHQGSAAAGNRRVVLVCGLQPALDDRAKGKEYRANTKTVLDMAFADLMLQCNLTIIQALRKKKEDRINIVRQLALACLHFALTTCAAHGNIH